MMETNNITRLHKRILYEPERNKEEKLLTAGRENSSKKAQATKKSK
jgi:hypothetical protein